MIKYVIIFFIVIVSISIAKDYNTFTVAQDGSGEFSAITDAINALPMFNYEQIVIFIKNGRYNEKFRLECDYVTLCGESRNSVIVEYSQLREDWINNKDDIAQAVINIYSDKIL